MKTGLSESVNIVGHPFATTGRGEDARCTYRALRSLGIKTTVTDVYGERPSDWQEFAEFSNALSDRPSAINIHIVNGDDVKRAMAHLPNHNPLTGYNIIYPVWELERYPAEWAKRLDRFDEIWVPSQFVKDAVGAACAKPVLHMPWACEVLLSSFLSRRFFGIPESDYTFLFSFDLRSYPERKNPQAVIEAFQNLLLVKPFDNVRLVLKVNGTEHIPDFMDRMRTRLGNAARHVTLIGRTMSDNEAKNLTRCCDCYISLHRSEGFGRGIAEAMYLGKPVIATGYSGNMEFTTSDNAFLVPYTRIPLVEGDYPEWHGQVWAAPDPASATRYMAALVENPRMGRAIGERARQQMLTHHSYRESGMRYRRRFDQIANRDAR